MKFRYKLMLGFLCTLCLSFGIGGMLIINHAFHYSLSEEISKCMQNYVSIQNTIKIAGDNSESNYSEIIKTVISQINDKKLNEYEYVQLVDWVTGDIIFSSSRDRLSKQFGTNEANDIISTYKWKENKHYYYQISGNITINSKENNEQLQIYNMCVVYNITSVYAFRDNEANIYRKMIIVFIIIGVIITFLMAIWITRPMEQLSDVVRKIANGDIHYRSQIHSGDEIEKLSIDINSMADTIESDMNKLRESVEKQERFMGSFAHEMKTPMTSIIGYADLIRSHNLSMEEIKESANYIFNEGKRLEALSLKMLELIVLNNEQVNLKLYNPADVINDVVKMLEYSLKENDIILKVSCEPAIVMLDIDLFKSLMINLIDNAVKSIEENGIISITAKKRKADMVNHELNSKSGDAITTKTENIVNSNGNDKAEYNYIVQITDNGRGMSQEELSKITEAFYRVDKSRSRAQGGAGLGLAICKRIVELHNAILNYRSAQSIGTTAELILEELSAKEDRVGKILTDRITKDA